MTMVSGALGGMPLPVPDVLYAYSDCIVTVATSPRRMVGTACFQPSITCCGSAGVNT